MKDFGLYHRKIMICFFLYEKEYFIWLNLLINSFEVNRYDMSVLKILKLVHRHPLIYSLRGKWS